MAGTWQKWNAIYEGETPPSIERDIFILKKGSINRVQFAYTDTAKAGKECRILIYMEDLEETQAKTLQEYRGTVSSTGKVTGAVLFDSIPFPFPVTSEKTHNVAKIFVYIEFDDSTYAEKSFQVWVPEVLVSNFKVYRSDSSGNYSNSQNYITMSAHVGYDLPSRAIASSFDSLFCPIGAYYFGIEGKDVTEWGFVTNTGTEEAYRKARNGYDVSITLEATGCDFKRIRCIFKTEILKDVGSTVVYYASEEFYYEISDSPFYLSAKNKGIGIGGAPLNASEANPLFEVHWNAQFNRNLSVNGIDMTLSDETIALWTKILGGG